MCRERERERERDSHTHTYICMYMYCMWIDRICSSRWNVFCLGGWAEHALWGEMKRALCVVRVYEDVHARVEAAAPMYSITDDYR